MPTIRYLVNDVDASVRFYQEQLGFTLEQRWGPAFAIVAKDGLTLWLSGPASSAAKALPDGRKPQPGGWNRLVLTMDGIETQIAKLKASGVTFRNDLITGPGGSQALIEDPDGNPIELFEPRG